ncbi:MAG TPA: hypothetical protein VF472_23005 [Burkholderiaceae bacterium]
MPQNIRFKETDGKVRPVAPFLEVYARTSAEPDLLRPLTPELLAEEGLSLADLHWDVELGNIKIFRRTADKNDQIHARLHGLKNHTRHAMEGHCPNFLKGKVLPLGHVQYIKPTEAFPGIRLRYTPAAGIVYGTRRVRIETAGEAPVPDPIIDDDALVLFDENKTTWLGYSESSGPTLTNPASIYAGYINEQGNQTSWGYLDDECDGVVRVVLKLADGTSLRAEARIGAGPPAYAPDTMPVRVISDELEQILHGPSVMEDEVSLDDATELVFRALETVRLMNTAVMNGNPVNGRLDVASTMVRQNTNDFERIYEPIAATSLVDNLALRALHERVFGALAAGGAPWFEQLLRRPHEIGDLSATALRKMPALMRGADGRSLTLTRRHIDMVTKAARNALFGPAPAADERDIPPGSLEADNLTAQLHHRGTGSPASILPRTGISNCFPGLEFDFRNLWRRAFEGITLVENNNYVVAAEPPHEDLHTRRLLRFGKPGSKPEERFDTMVATSGPVFPDGDPNATSGPLITSANPNGVSFMEWSNSMARIVDLQGELVECDFSDRNADAEVISSPETRKLTVTLRMRKFFEDGTEAFNPALLQPGELTQGLCAPWQNDYRECACYYWAATRPDYVNVEAGTDGLSHGDMWFAKKRTGQYVADNRSDTRLWSYDDLFKSWQEDLRFIIRGKDADES